jgi:hypothetical protein
MVRRPGVIGLFTDEVEDWEAVAAREGGCLLEDLSLREKSPILAGASSGV